MKKIIVLPLFFLLQVITYAQADFFAFVNNDQGRTSTETALDYKLETTQKVFDALVEGLSYFPRQKPTLLMKDSERYVAWAVPEKEEIGLEELAYDICASFGPDSLNAIAALLTHELVHYYKEHEWSRHFAKENKELSTARQLEKLEEGIKLETQADVQGGFLAYSVGFDVHGIMPELLKKVYSEEGYDLPAEIDGYPSLQDRITMSEKATLQLKKLQVVFETANYLNLLEQYDAADKYYDFIIKDFKSREIYNNAGVTALLSALPFFTKKEMPYALPVELEPTSRLGKRTTRNMDLTRQQERKKRIRKALEDFEWSYRLDQQYAPALLNKATAFLLLKEWEDAEYWLRKARKEDLSPKLSADLLVLEGVIAAQQEDQTGARKFWEQAAEMNNYLAEINLHILQSGELPPEPEEEIIGYAAVDKQEQIAELDLNKFLMQTTPDLTIKVDERTFCGLHKRSESVIYSHSLDRGKEFISIQLVDHSFTGESLEGIRVSDSRDQLLKAYGSPGRQVQTPKGAYLIYPGRNLFFELNEQAEVAGWGVYRIK